MRELREEREQRRRAAASAIQLQIEDRKVRLEEAQAVLVLQVIDRMLVELGVVDGAGAGTAARGNR